MRLLPLLLILVLATSLGVAPDSTLRLHLREQKPTAPGATTFQTVTETQTWDARKTAVIICDMWDRHWCDGATARVGELAPAMNAVLRQLRRRGALIVHCPSETMDYYKDAPQRKHAQDAPKAAPPPPFHNARPPEPPLPIDDSDGGCDTGPDTSHRTWTRENPAIEIAAEDAVSDNGDEVCNLLRHDDRENVIVMGVHTNMCVLGRPFSIRRLAQAGFNVILMRDMTDTMYNPKRRPFVSHFEGTDLVVKHIETYWCPSVTSSDITGKPPFRFRADTRTAR